MYWNHRFYFYHLLTSWMPNATFLMPLKRGLLRLCGVEVGDDVIIDSSVRFIGSGKIVLNDGVKLFSGVQIGGRGKILLGKNVEVWNDNVIRANGMIEVGDRTQIYQSNILMANGSSKLTIGADCQVAHMVSLKTSTHDIEPESSCIAGHERFDDIAIGDGCWLCAGVIVIPGVRVGKKNVIAAGSCVIKNTDDYSLMAGVPAVCKKKYEVK